MYVRLRLEKEESKEEESVSILGLRFAITFQDFLASAGKVP